MSVLDGAGNDLTNKKALDTTEQIIRIIDKLEKPLTKIFSQFQKKQETQKIKTPSHYGAREFLQQKILPESVEQSNTVIDADYTEQTQDREVVEIEQEITVEEQHKIISEWIEDTVITWNCKTPEEVVEHIRLNLDTIHALNGRTQEFIRQKKLVEKYRKERGYDNKDEPKKEPEIEDGKITEPVNEEEAKAILQHEEDEAGIEGAIAAEMDDRREDEKNKTK